MWMNVLITLTVAAGYYFFHWQFFAYMRQIFLGEEKKRRAVNLAFAANYLWFIVGSVLKLHLVVNWTLFFLLLVLEIWSIYKGRLRESMMMALLGIIIGLASSVLMRGVMALLLDKPVAVFDNRVNLADNIKQYPILLGFLLAGMLLAYYRKKGMDRSLRLIFADASSLHFNLAVQSVLYLYLTLNLLGYYVPGNSPALKIWEIKSAVFAVLGSNICSIYTVRLSRLNLYRSKLVQDRNEKLEHKKKEERAWLRAFTDPLTECYNRYYLEEVLRGYQEKNIRYCLCFVDIDGLKYVNDRLGHPEGDSYLKTVAGVLNDLHRKGQDMLFRYGGDEFTLLYRESLSSKVEERMQEAVRRLGEMSGSDKFPFPMSISFGIVDSWEEELPERQLELADRRMYQQKKEKGKQRKGRE